MSYDGLPHPEARQISAPELRPSTRATMRRMCPAHLACAFSRRVYTLGMLFIIIMVLKIIPIIWYKLFPSTLWLPHFFRLFCRCAGACCRRSTVCAADGVGGRTFIMWVVFSLLVFQFQCISVVQNQLSIFSAGRCQNWHC